MYRSAPKKLATKTSIDGLFRNSAPLGFLAAWFELTRAMRRFLFSGGWRRLSDARRQFLQRLAASLGDEPQHDHDAKQRAGCKQRRRVAQTAEPPREQPDNDRRQHPADLPNHLHAQTIAGCSNRSRKQLGRERRRRGARRLI